MMRRSAVMIALAVSACAPEVPESGPGVGFQDYNSYIRGTYTPTPPPVTAAPSGSFDPAAASAAIDRAEGTGSLAPAGAAPAATPEGTRPRGGAPAGIQEQTGEMIHAAPGISDENDFDAVAARETIESDKQRIEQNRAQYVVVQPKDLPVRPGDTGPNIVAYALATTNNPGTPLYHRTGRKDATAACAKFTSPDFAQQEFLAKGGPERDRLKLDPDGDGFACDWDPRPFRTALQ